MANEAGPSPEGGPSLDGGAGTDGSAPCGPRSVSGCEDFTTPCSGLVSGFAGDEFCIAPPAPELGFQIHVGPIDYSDPDDVAKYVLLPGEDPSWTCVFL